MGYDKKKKFQDRFGGLNVDMALQDPPRGRSNSGRGSEIAQERRAKPIPKVQLELADMEGSLPIELPHNFFRPMGTESVDIRRLRNVVNGTNDLAIFSFTAPKSAGVVFTHYGVFTDILLASNVLFIPRIQGRRALRYHGDPNDNFKINLSISSDLSEQAMIPCELYLKPGQTLTWSVSNNSGADGPMGIRMTGYVDTKSTRSGSDFGG